MTEQEYVRVRKIARRATYGLKPTPDELEEIYQEAALIAWRSGLDPCTRVWWGSRDALARLRGSRRALQPVFVDMPDWWEQQASDNVEDEVVNAVTATEMLASLPSKDAEILREIYINGYNTMSVAKKLGMHDCNVGRRRTAALKKLKGG